MNIIAKERLCLTADRSRLVSANDPAAAFLFCAVGQTITEADARRYGLIATPETVQVSLPKTKAVEPKSEMKNAPEIKPVEPEESKVEYPQESKRQKGKRGVEKIVDVPPTGEPASPPDDGGARG